MNLHEKMLEKVVLVSKYVDYDVYKGAVVRYGEDIANILKGELTDDIREKIVSCKGKDRRTPEHYGIDLVLGWILEDYILRQLRLAGLSVRLNGGDSERKVLDGTRITHSSDLMVNGILFEHVTSYTGHYTEEKTLHMRDWKLPALKRRGSWVIAVDIMHKTFYVFDTNNVEAEYIPEHEPWYNKPAYEVNLSNIPPLSLNELIHELSFITKTTA